MCIITGNKETVSGYNRALTNQTAKNIFSKDAPTNNDSAITNDPGKAYVNIVEKMLSWILNPKFLRSAPIATKQQPSAMAGLSGAKIDLNPLKKKLFINH